MSGVITEFLSSSQRMKAKQRMRRKRARLKLGARKARRRIATRETLKRRAMRDARAQIVRRLTRGKSKAKLSYASRANIERQVAARKTMVKALAVRLLPKVRKMDRSKFTRTAK